MSIVIEIDRKFGGFYFYRSNTSKRLCLGFVAITAHPFSIYDKVKPESKSEK